MNIAEDEAIHLRLDVGEDGELRTEYWKVQFHNFLIEPWSQTKSSIIKLRQNLDRERTRHLERRMSRSVGDQQNSINRTAQAPGT